jgi:hypothetical protein
MGTVKEGTITSYAKLIEKAKKLKALADRGIAGEKKSAENFYRDFIAKHNIKEEDIDPKHHIRSFRLKGQDYSVLLSHIILSVNPFIIIDKKKGQYEVVLDDEDYIEVTERVNFFYDAFKREKELFFIAFMDKFSSNFVPDEQAVEKHSQVAKKMAEDAEILFNSKNPKSKEEKKDEYDPLNQPSEEEKMESDKQAKPTITNRDVKKIEVYKKCIDNLRYTKANRRIGSGKK